MTPEQYIAGKFNEYDIVIAGEFHRVKHDAELIQRLIPHLYQQGVYDLGIEFGNWEDQSMVDSLLNAAEYSEAMVRSIMFNNDPSWAYIEYEDIYKAAWTLNRSLPEKKPRFRVVHLNYNIRWDLNQENMVPEIEKLVYYKGNYDEHMAEIAIKEFVEKKRKALIFCGTHHAFTRYRQPRYNFERKELITFFENRMGQLLYRVFPGKVFMVALHVPWPSKNSFAELIYPANGLLDKVLTDLNRPTGFDVRDSPFGEISDTCSYYSLGHPDFKLSDFCDGYVYQKPIYEYEGCTFDSLFINTSNILKAVRMIPNPTARKRNWTIESFVNSIKSDADIKRRFSTLK